MLEEDDSSTINVVSPNARAYATSNSIASANAVQTSASVESSRVKTKATQNAALLRSSLELSLQWENQPLALLLKSAITGINDLLKAQFGVNAIQVAASTDNTPSGTAGRIVSLSTGFYETFKQQHLGENASDVLTKFMDTIRGGFEQGAKEAQVILTSMGVLWVILPATLTRLSRWSSKGRPTLKLHNVPI